MDDVDQDWRAALRFMDPEDDARAAPHVVHGPTLSSAQSSPQRMIAMTHREIITGDFEDDAPAQPAQALQRLNATAAILQRAQDRIANMRDQTQRAPDVVIEEVADDPVQPRSERQESTDYEDSLFCEEQSHAPHPQDDGMDRCWLCAYTNTGEGRTNPEHVSAMLDIIYSGIGRKTIEEIAIVVHEYFENIIRRPALRRGEYIRRLPAEMVQRHIEENHSLDPRLAIALMITRAQQTIGRLRSKLWACDEIFDNKSLASLLKLEQHLLHLYNMGRSDFKKMMFYDPTMRTDGHVNMSRMFTEARHQMSHAQVEASGRKRRAPNVLPGQRRMEEMFEPRSKRVRGGALVTKAAQVADEEIDDIFHRISRP